MLLKQTNVRVGADFWKSDFANSLNNFVLSKERGLNFILYVHVSLHKIIWTNGIITKDRETEFWIREFHCHSLISLISCGRYNYTIPPDHKFPKGFR